MVLLILLSLPSCTWEFAGPFKLVDQSGGLLENPGIWKERPQDTMETVWAICEADGCVRRDSGVVYAYFLKGDEYVRRHEYDHYLYGPHHVE